MARTYVRVTISPVDAESSGMLVALLSELGYQGFEEGGDSLQAFIESSEFKEDELRPLVEMSAASYSLSTEEERNWNAIWESSFEPVIIPGFVAVRADFHAPVAYVQHEILITPKMSFGTGHHATTAMMLRYLLEVNPAGKDVFDFGCGTGVLAILAARMGAKKVLATDHDPICVENTSENCMENGVEQVEVSMQDIGDVHASYDLILANINLNILKAHMTDLYKRLRPSGELLLSGILQQDQEAIRTAAIAAGFELVSSKTEEEWLAMQLRKAADL